MISKETIREDLKNIRFYYSRREIFENGESQIGGSAFYPVVQKYNQAIREAHRDCMTCMSVCTFSIKRKRISPQRSVSHRNMCK